MSAFIVVDAGVTGDYAIILKRQLYGKKHLRSIIG